MEWSILASIAVGVMFLRPVSPSFFGLTSIGFALSSGMSYLGYNILFQALNIILFMTSGFCLMMARRAILSNRDKVFNQNLVGIEGIAIMRLERLKSGIVKLDSPILGNYEWLAHPVDGDIYPGQRIAVVSSSGNTLFVDFSED